MVKIKNLLNKLRLEQSFVIWAEGKTIEQIVSDCKRGDRLLLLAYNINLPSKQLVLTKALCAKIIVPLMKDKSFIRAVEMAEKFGKGECSEEDLEEEQDAE